MSIFERIANATHSAWTAVNNLGTGSKQDPLKDRYGTEGTLVTIAVKNVDKRVAPGTCAATPDVINPSWQLKSDGHWVANLGDPNLPRDVWFRTSECLDRYSRTLQYLCANGQVTLEQPYSENHQNVLYNAAAKVFILDPAQNRGEWDTYCNCPHDGLTVEPTYLNQAQFIDFCKKFYDTHPEPPAPTEPPQLPDPTEAPSEQPSSAAPPEIEPSSAAQVSSSSEIYYDASSEWSSVLPSSSPYSSLEPSSSPAPSSSAQVSSSAQASSSVYLASSSIQNPPSSSWVEQMPFSSAGPMTFDASTPGPVETFPPAQSSTTGTLEPIATILPSNDTGLRTAAAAGAALGPVALAGIVVGAVAFVVIGGVAAGVVACYRYMRSNPSPHIYEVPTISVVSVQATPVQAQSSV